MVNYNSIAERRAQPIVLMDCPVSSRLGCPRPDFIRNVLRMRSDTPVSAGQPAERIFSHAQWIVVCGAARPKTPQHNNRRVVSLVARIHVYVIVVNLCAQSHRSRTRSSDTNTMPQQNTAAYHLSPHRFSVKLCVRNGFLASCVRAHALRRRTALHSAENSPGVGPHNWTTYRRHNRNRRACIYQILFSCLTI